VAPLRAEPGEPVALLPVARAAVAAQLWGEPAEVAAPRQVAPGEAAVLRGGAARQREARSEAGARPPVAPAAAALPLAAAWAFRRDRLRLAVRQRSAPSARAMRSLRTAAP